MRCETAQRDLSAAMHEAAPARAETRRHAESCPRCSRFLTDLHRLHQLARLEPATPVPDLVPVIMAHVREDRIASPKPLPPRRHRKAPRSVARRTIAAGIAAGIVVGFVLGNGGLFPGGGNGPSALAAEIPKRLLGAAFDLRGYRATFSVVERNWSPRVPLRTFYARLWFSAPESFRVVVRDTTRYPSGAWPRNDLRLVTNGRQWRASGPNPCPPAELPACHQNSIERSVVGRGPFDDQSPMPTDLIVPMTVLAAQDRVQVIGSDTVGVRDAEAVSLSYQDAAPLFASLQFLGSWRPFYPQDRVVVWLDRSTWFPLRFEVFPASGPERRLWAAQFGVEGDRPGRPSFQATIRSLSTEIPAAATFTVPPSSGANDEGFRDLPVGSVTRDLSLPPSVGLGLTRYGAFARTRSRPFDESVAAYSTGLAWATVARVEGWRERRLFGVGEFAERVSLADGTIGYYEPAISNQPRRVAMHTDRGEFLIASNLPRERLLAIAEMLGASGRSAPGSWFVRRWSGGVVRGGLTPREAINRAPFEVLIPTALPPGYEGAAAQSVDAPRVRGVTLVYRRPAAELDGVGLRVFEAMGESLPPPQSVSEQAVPVRGVVGRWSAEGHLLEWVEDGVYFSLQSPAFDLSTMLGVARSLRPERE